MHTYPAATNESWRRMGFGVVFLVGLAAAVLPVVGALDTNVSGLDIASLGAAVVEVGLLWAVAINLRNDRFEDGDVLLVAAWTVALAGVGLAIGSAVVVTQGVAGGSLVEPLLLLNHIALVGGVTGALVGSYDARMRFRERALERERERLADRSARLAFMNQLLRHDIRNDANVIQGYVGLLADRIDGEYGELDRIERKADHVAELTTVAGDLASSLDAESRATALEPVLRESVTAVRESFPEAVIRYVDGAEDVTVAGSPLLSSVFRNLIRNAVQHNDNETPSVVIEVETDVDAVVVSVSDDGPGIDPDVRERLFSPGERDENSTGLGLGLHLVETIVTDLGGEVEVSENEPRGATFTVILPRRRELSESRPQR